MRVSEKSKIKIMLAENGNFNIVTEFGAIGLFCSWKAWECWELTYGEESIKDFQDSKDFVEKFNADNNEVDYKSWSDLVFNLDANEDNWYGITLDNGKYLKIIAEDNGWYTCKIERDVIK